jgi:hypothetical protein
MEKFIPLGKPYFERHVEKARTGEDEYIESGRESSWVAAEAG